MVSIGTAAIIVGGLFSAVTARAATYHSAWLVAYLVLIVGVAQIILGIGQRQLAVMPLGVGGTLALALLYNLGNVGVMYGTLQAATLWVDVGSALLVIALLWCAWAARSPRRSPARWAYWLFVALLLGSVIVGVALAHRTAS